MHLHFAKHENKWKLAEADSALFEMYLTQNLHSFHSMLLSTKHSLAAPKAVFVVLVYVS